MEGYGFAETMETIYALNLYMIYALKAYAKALRCYLLIETLLQQMLFSKVRAEKKKITDNSFVEINQLFSLCLKVQLIILMDTPYKVRICSTDFLQ